MMNIVNMNKKNLNIFEVIAQHLKILIFTNFFFQYENDTLPKD